MHNHEVLTMGSVKDLEVIKSPTPDVMGVGRFHFSDRYSVFDWGEMPDHIPGKGAALCLMGAYCFEHLEERGIKTHYKGLVDSNGKTISFKQANQPTNIMEVCLVNIYRPETRTNAQGKLEYDYSAYIPKLKNCLIPLEIIYRNGLPEGSSVFRRLEQGKTTLKELGLDHYPQPGERFTKPIFDVSTKLEQTDRYLSWEEAKKIACLTDQELIEIKAVLAKVNDIITEIASRGGLINEDGKIELAFDDQRKLMVVDVVGTLDECRFTYDGLHVSKKTPWYQDLEEAKKTAEAKGIKEWTELCKSQPPKLDPKLRTIISEMYISTANELSGRKLFNASHLADIIQKYKKFMVEKV
jgi:phosphoribosylaminoimidazole-succinocarboxamide synthase